ncbi:Holin of 3TMs, for gene-transfer release [uncultured Caudovirales phage]|uniref:Holin of 3TMs, for gene-transfer release n=1 Tax=uncultured Caudovirales phage TaxID=2100421 RepID=A0A6J5KL49_9CAUD|nr:Holin of 3TMs, for gene-transfer release [uncultured Caudovirales phage]CAB4123726.1 Holin of 3TMs, for gene-transfer release [uncultured Caudovirales phage]
MFPLLEALTPIVSKVLDLIPDPNARARAEAEMQAQLITLAAQQAQQQSEVNKVEAASSSLFVSGWRPAVGWICAAALAWNYALFPMVAWLVACFGIVAPLKPLMDGNLMELTLGMLGMGALRSFDKSKGTAS